MRDLTDYEIGEEQLDFIIGGAGKDKNDNVINVQCPKCGQKFGFELGCKSYTCPFCHHSEKISG